MSPRAAWRLESLGFTEVYDYTGGKATGARKGSRWKARPALAPASTSAPTSAPVLSTSACKRCARLRASEWDTRLVANETRGVLGRLGRRALAREDDVTVEEAMSSRPSTVRPNVTVEAMLERMRRQNLNNVVVTRLDGVLLGLLRREDAERLLASAAVLPPVANGDTVEA